MPWAVCVDLLHQNGAEKVYFEPLTNDNGSSLFMSEKTFTDKNGNKRKSVSVVVKEISFCGSKSESTSNAQQFTQPASAYASADNSDFEEIVDDDDDLPF